MRVCLIVPPRLHPKSWGEPNVFQPLDLAYIAAHLEEYHQVKIIDSPTEGLKNLEHVNSNIYRVGLDEKELEYRIKKWTPDVVGISVPFSGWSRTTFETASMIKSIDHNIVTFLEGEHASARPAACLKHPEIDYVIIGEPEETISELVGMLELGRTSEKEKIRGIAYNKDEKTIITPPRLPIENLNSLPYPARHLLPMQTYFSVVSKHPLRGEISKPWATMLTSRGCPHDCVFCTKHIIMGKKWRSRNPENVVDEIEQLVQTYKVKQIDFTDDNMTLDRKRMKNICELIVERGIDIEWFNGNGVRVDTLDEHLLRKMKTSGCKNIRIAPESGVQSVVNQVIKKNLDLQKVEQVVELSKKVGMNVGCFFVIGLIGETQENIKNTIKFAWKLRHLGVDHFYFSYAMPHYGSELYEQAKHGGFLVHYFCDEALAAAQPLIETPEFTANDLQELMKQANLVHPTFTRNKIIRAIKNPVKTLKILMGKKY